jgi:hypothetical protein
VLAAVAGATELLLADVSTGLREDDAVVSYHPDPRPSLRARLRLALRDRRGRDDLNRPVHHERGRCSLFGCPRHIVDARRCGATAVRPREAGQKPHPQRSALFPRRDARVADLVS